MYFYCTSVVLSDWLYVFVCVLLECKDNNVQLDEL